MLACWQQQVLCASCLTLAGRAAGEVQALQGSVAAEPGDVHLGAGASQGGP